MKFLIVDDHQIFRTAFCHLLKIDYDPLSECFEAANGIEALDRLKELKVDAIFLDVSMPQMNGIDACKEIRDRHPNVPIIMLTHSYEKALIFHFFNIGVQSFLTKDVNADEIKRALDCVLAGGRYFPVDIEILIRIAIKEENVKQSQKIGLTQQEKRLFDMLRKGQTSKEIAMQMKLTAKTIDTYRERLLQKTKTNNVAELISFGFKTGILH